MDGRINRLSFVVAGLLMTVTGRASPVDGLFDWGTILPTSTNALQNGGAYVPIGWAERPDFSTSIISNSQLGYPTGLQTRGLLASDSRLITALNFFDGSAYPLNYLFLDLEGSNTQNITDVINLVHSHSSLSTLIGNYNFYPGAGADPAQQWPTDYQSPGWIAVDDFYRSSGLHIAQPSLYPYSSYITHTSATINGVTYVGGASPNQRSALFWDPLEHFSVAKRNLPAGDLLVPYVTDFIQWYGGNNDPHNPPYLCTQDQVPTPQDNAASIIHYRLRGADGIYGFPVNADQTQVTTYYASTYGVNAYAAYSRDMAAAWHTVDSVFNRPGVSRILNLSTSKSSGLEWSAFEKGNRIATLVSNLSGSSKAVDWSGYPHFPGQSPTVATGVHTQLRYRSDYLYNDNMEEYAPSLTMNTQGANSWKGPQASALMAQLPPGSGNNSGQAVLSSGGNNIAWFATQTPDYAASDKVVYSGWLYNSSGGVGFEPANVTGTDPGSRPALAYQGPLLSFNGNMLTLRGTYDNGPLYTAVNLAVATNKWYEVKLVIDPTAGSMGLGSVYIRDATDGQADFTRVVFDDSTTLTVTERLIQVPLNLGASNNPTDFNGFVVTMNGSASVDNINTGYYVPRSDDNFDHYDPTATNNANQTTSTWYGPATHGASEWTVHAPYQVNGNSSALAATPTSTAYTPNAWWRTERPDFAPSEYVVYSGMLYGTGGIGFEAVNTSGGSPTNLVPNNQVGFSTYIYWGVLRFRASDAAGPVYGATNFTAQPGKWYNVQVQIDPTRDIDGTAGGFYGVARVWVKNVTDNTAPVLMTFDDLAPTGAKSLTEMPLFLSPINNPGVWDGWQVYGYDQNHQIDNLRSYLFPYTDFATNNLYIDDSRL